MLKDRPVSARKKRRKIKPELAGDWFRFAAERDSVGGRTEAGIEQNARQKRNSTRASALDLNPKSVPTASAKKMLRWEEPRGERARNIASWRAREGGCDFPNSGQSHGGGSLGKEPRDSG